MIADQKPYADYKDSGPSWLGKVPAHWQIVRSKRLFTSRKELARPEDVQLSATQAYGVIPQSLYEERTGYRVVKISMHLDKRRHVERDDFIISMRSFQGGLERAWSTGAIRSSYVVLKPDAQVDAAYFRHLFKSDSYIAALRATGDFIRDGQDLNYSNFCGVDLPLMPPMEQAAIGRFLDWANSRMERAIRAKAGHHQPCNHARNIRGRSPQPLWQFVARTHSRTLGAFSAPTTLASLGLQAPNGPFRRGRDTAGERGSGQEFHARSRQQQENETGVVPSID